MQQEIQRSDDRQRATARPELTPRRADVVDFADHRPQAMVQRQTRHMIDHSPRQQRAAAMVQMIRHNPRADAQQQQIMQLFDGEGRSAAGDAALQSERPYQAQATDTAGSAAASPAAEAPGPNRTGLPDQLKSGIESLSGMRMDHVNVHYNSSQPAQLQAHAYAQGSEIHIAPGQERHLPHEAWHVVQQAQGRVTPTVQTKTGPLNDDSELEQKADRMGEQAMQAGVGSQAAAADLPAAPGTVGVAQAAVIQRELDREQLDLIAAMPRSVRIEYLARVSEEEWQQALNADLFNHFGAIEEIDEIYEQRQFREDNGETASPSWLAPIPDGNARLAAKNLAMPANAEELDVEVLLAHREAFLTLIRNRVQIAYLEDLEQQTDEKLDDDDPEPVPEFLHPAGDDHWLPLPAPGKSLYWLHYIIARKSDPVALWQEYLLSGVAMSGEDGVAPQHDDGDQDIEDLIAGFGALSISEPKAESDPEVDELTAGIAALSINDRIGSGIEPMDIDTVKEEHKNVLVKSNYDADGDFIMGDDFDGSSDVEMSDVHGTMNISYHNVTGDIIMDIEEVNADMDIEIRDVSGSVHIVLMEIDLSDDDNGVQHMDIVISGVSGAMEIEISDYGEPMDIELGDVAKGSFQRVSYRKRKREITAEDEAEMPKTKRRRLAEKEGPATSSIEDLIDLFEALSISFRTGLDKEEHKIYPEDGLGDVIVRSDPTPLSTIIADKEWLGTALSTAEVATLTGLQGKVEDALNDIKKNASKPNNEKLRKAMVKVAGFLSKKGTVDIPKTDLSGSTNFTAASGIGSTVVGKKVMAEPVSVNSDVPGTKAADGALIDAVRTKLTKLGSDSSYVIGAHFLNMKLWGPGELWNLTPASKKFNSDQESKIEDPMKRAVYEDGVVMSYTAEASYNNYPVGLDYATSPEKYFFTQIKFTAKQWHEDTTTMTWAEDAKVKTHADVKAINRTMAWNQGNLPPFKPTPNVHTETVKKPFSDLGFKASFVEAVTTYNASVAVGAAIPGTTKTRKRWPGNVGIDTVRDDLQQWLKTKGTVGGYTGNSKSVPAAAFPDNWKKVLDFS